MLSSVNAFGGLSAAELLTLFGANSSSSSSNSTRTSTAQAASAGIDASGANGPANAIQAILAQAQIDKAQTVGSGGGSSISITAQAANATPTPAPGISITAETAYAAQTLGGSASNVIAELAGEYDSSLLTSTYSFSSTSSTSGLVDTFQASISVGNDSVAVGFALEGLGQVEDSGGELSVGQGDLADFFQIEVSVDSQVCAIAFNVAGLDATQAQQLAGAFEEATSTPDNTGSTVNTEDYGPDFSVQYSELIGYPTT